MTFTDEISTGAVVAQGGATAVAIAFFQNTLLNMIPYAFVALVLVLVDLYFGIKAARHRGEAVRTSRAVRRTVGKLFEYSCWLLLTETLAVAFGAKWIEWVILGIVVGVELLSVINNYLEIHDKKIVGFNIFKIIGDKVGADLSDVQVVDTAGPARDAKTGRFVKKEDAK